MKLQFGSMFAEISRGKPFWSVLAPKWSYKSTRFALSDYEAGESSVSFLPPRCPHTAPQCGPAEIHGCFILEVLRGFSRNSVVNPAISSRFVTVYRKIKCFTKPCSATGAKTDAIRRCKTAVRNENRPGGRKSCCVGFQITFGERKW